jgi:hypothetical protein
VCWLVPSLLTAQTWVFEQNLPPVLYCSAMFEQSSRWVDYCSVVFVQSSPPMWCCSAVFALEVAGGQRVLVAVEGLLGNGSCVLPVARKHHRPV